MKLPPIILTTGECLVCCITPIESCIHFPSREAFSKKIQWIPVIRSCVKCMRTCMEHTQMEQCTNCLTCSQFHLHVFAHFFHVWIALFTSRLCQFNDDVTGFNQGFPGARPLQAVMQNLISLPITISLRYFSWQLWGTMPLCFSSPTTTWASTSVRNCLRNKSRMSLAGRKWGHRHSSKFAFAHECPGYVN